MKSLLIAILMMTTAFAGEGFKSGTYMLNGVADSGAKLTVTFTLEENGSISSLTGDLFNFMEEFFAKEEWAMADMGFYKTIPKKHFEGGCYQPDSVFWHMNCVITINFTDEEKTTLMIHFEDTFGGKAFGSMLESHGDQAMHLYQQAFEFRGIHMPLPTII